MDALFVVPTLVSQTVNKRLVPFIEKLVERNILLNNSATFERSLIWKYKKGEPFKESFLGEAGKDGHTVDQQKEKKSYRDKAKDYYNEHEDKAKGYWGDAGDYAKGKVEEWEDEALGDMTDKELDKYKDTRPGRTGKQPKPAITDPTKVELPHNITFFSNMSVEPTFLRVPISTPVTKGKGGRSEERIAVIGMKCASYTVDSTNIVAMLENMKSWGLIKGFVFRNFNSLKGKLMVGSRRWKTHVLGLQTHTPDDILYAPSPAELRHSRVIKAMMSGRNSKNWYSLVVLSSDDFDGDLRETLNSYANLTRAGWGDIVIIDTMKDLIYFCNSKINACQEIHMSYLKNIMNLSNVIDYSNANKVSKPFNTVSVGRAFRENDTGGDLMDMIDDIIVE